MITLNFHWAWLLIATLVIIGIIGFFYYAEEAGDGPAAGIAYGCGCFIFIVCVLIGLILGGIFIW